MYVCMILLGYVIQKILSKVSLEIPVCMRKRMDNNRMLGLELSFVLREVHVTLRQLPFSELMHVIIGLYFSFLRRDAVEVSVYKHAVFCHILPYVYVWGRSNTVITPMLKICTVIDRREKDREMVVIRM